MKAPSGNTVTAHPAELPHLWWVGHGRLPQCSFPWAAGMLTTRPRAARGRLLLGAVGSSLLHVLSRLPEGAVTLTFLGLQTRRYPSSLSPRAALSVCLGAHLTLVCLMKTPASGLIATLVQYAFTLITPAKGLVPRKDIFTGDRSYSLNIRGTEPNPLHLTISHRENALRELERML